MKDFLSILRRYLPPYRGLLALSILFNLLSAFLTLFSFALIIPILEMLFKVREQTYAMMHLGDGSLKDVAVNNFYYYTQEAIANYGPSATLALLAAALVVMTALKTGTTYLSSYFLVPLRNGVVRDLRNQMYRKITSLNIGFFTNERKGDVMARMTGDVTEVEISVMASLDMLFRDPVLIIVYLGTMIAISWQLTVFVLVLLPGAGYVMGNVGRRLKRASLENQTQWGVLMANIEETLGALRVILGFGAAKTANARFAAENQRYCDMSNRVARRQALAHPMSEFLGTAAIAVILWFGGSLILGGHTTLNAAGFIFYMVIFYSIINPAKDLSKAMYAIQKGLASMQRIDKILGAQNTVPEPQMLRKAPTLTHGVTLEGVSFRYPGSDEDVLSDINISIPRGHTVALVGESGSGKSTLADLLPRFYDPTAGTISIDGVDLRDHSTGPLRALMGIVSQEPILFNDTIYNNIAFGKPDATPDQVEHAARIANAHGFITQTPEGYQTVVGDRGCRLSGGQRQRISIARAVLHDPQLLILDEATSALDSESEAAVQQALERLMKGRTALVIAHRLSTVRSADTIYVLQKGRIAQSGTHDQLLAQDGIYRRLCDLQGVVY